jgi:RHS repeat-associated core domain
VRKAPTNPRQYLSALAEGTSYDLTAREYIPSIGQFLSPDPAANPGMGYQYGDANPMVSIDPSGRKASNWQSVTASISAGRSATSGTVGSACTNAVLCSTLTSGPALLANQAGAVSGASDGSEASCSSTKGGCPQAVAQGALDGSVAGAGLHKVSQAEIWGGVAEIGAGLALLDIAVGTIVAFAATATVATAAAPETLGGSIAAVGVAGTTMVVESALMFTAGVLFIAQGTAQIQGSTSLPFDEVKKTVERLVNSAGR